MANKVFKGIRMPGLNDFYVLPEAVAIEDENGFVEIQSYISDAVEIENLDTTLTMAGKAADAAAVGTALSRKAPAGYGFGEMVTRQAGHDDANDVMGTGWYSAGTNTPDGTRWVIHVIQDFQDRTPHTIQIGHKDGLVARRTLNDDWTWTEWEWENPPYNWNKVYRTTERFCGYPVYAVNVACGMFIHGGTSITVPMTEDYIGEEWTVVGYEGGAVYDAAYIGNPDGDMIAKTGEYPIWYAVKGIRASWVTNGLLLTIEPTGNHSMNTNEGNMFVTVKFIKREYI